MKILAFDCFGTVFDMAAIPREEIQDYGQHVKREIFEPYAFPESWRHIKAHQDAAQGIRRLQTEGFRCVTLSNGSAELLSHVSQANGIQWDHIIDLAAHRVYKPHVDAYRTVEKDTGIKPEQTLMVTANPTFGDIEGSAAIGMPSQVIRHGPPDTIIALAQMLGA